MMALEKRQCARDILNIALRNLMRQEIARQIKVNPVYISTALHMTKQSDGRYACPENVIEKIISWSGCEVAI